MITQCRSCKSKKLSDVLTLGEQYLSDFIDKGDKKPEKHPLEMVICTECSLVQLKHTTPPKSLYHDRYGYYSGISNTIRADLEDVVNKALTVAHIKEGDIVVDIGSNDATLLKNYTSSLRRIGFDPVSKFKKYYDEENLQLVNDYFNAESYYQTMDKPSKIITSVSMFYDLDDPN